MSVKARIQSFLRSATGYELTRINKKETDPLLQFFAMLRRWNFEPKTIYDVGANRGGWTRSAVKYFPEASYVLVEPQDHLKINLQDLLDRGFKLEWINAGAGESPGIFPFSIAGRDDSSSFARGFAGSEGSPQVLQIEVKTLNQIAADRGGEMPELVKIDAEGWDLHVLKGASDLIGVTDIFLIEAAICAKGFENTYLEVVQTFDRIGYDLIDITCLNRSPENDTLWLVELAFLRRGHALLSHATRYDSFTF
ncbi:MAG TPA: FkbM family methyltransferase [Candidatus Methylacidiphilales bacterium]